MLSTSSKGVYRSSSIQGNAVIDKGRRRCDSKNRLSFRWVVKNSSKKFIETRPRWKDKNNVKKSIIKTKINFNRQQ